MIPKVLTTSDLSCSSYSSSSPSTWDVFLSFYRNDTHSNFTSHLSSGLDLSGSLTLIDDPDLGKRQETSSGLLNAIIRSKIFIVVLSENYASSCRSLVAREQKFMPFLYFTMLIHQMFGTVSFGKALDGHKKRYFGDMIVKWKSALSEIAKLSGHHLKKEANEKESDTTQQIAGIDSAVEEIIN